jgi:hypothetical protein
MKMLEDLEEVVPGELDKSAPAVIWLQIDTTGDNDDRSEPWPGTDGVTWQDESIGGQEIQYVRADLYRDMAARLEAAERDAALLDWLDQNAFSAYRNCDSIDGLSKHCVVVHEKPGPRRGNVADGIREAITQAMQETGR